MNMLNLLSEPFPSEVEKQLKKGGASLTYIPISEVITRLNKVLGVDMWSYEIIRCERDVLDPDFVVAHVRLSVTFVPTDKAPNIVVHKDGIGGQKIKRTRNGDILDLGDEMKGAVSDALKKAAQHFGVGIYLARSEESKNLEYVEEQAVSPISSEHFDKLRGLLNSQPQDIIEGAKSYWSTISDNADFSNSNVTGELLDKMLSWVKENKAGE
jgi:recombination DNA repair RAD52 pathway protein|tara:strand:- start:771 stop:1406 length:636 start_codon:yes stop_codon:yes gene_type:complete